MAAPGELSLGEWAVLGLLAAEPAHGFALARDLAAEGRLGRVWTVRRALVYRALDSLEEKGLVGLQGAEEGTRGPRRAVYRINPRGRRLFRAWRSRPVGHLRDIRSELMLKLAFLSLAGADPEPLLAAQLRVLEPIARGLGEKAAAADGFERTLALWRLESASTVARFIEALRGGRPQAG